jgi:FMNH2-dependent dimethyl sulfone monooxygenase
MTRYDRGRIVPTWSQQVRIAQAAEKGRLGVLLPLARWRGLGGDTNPNGAQFEVFSWRPASRR